MVDSFQDAHTHRAQEVQDQVYRDMTPARKLKILEDLYRMAWEIKTAGICSQHPTWTALQVRQAVKEAMLYARE